MQNVLIVTSSSTRRDLLFRRLAAVYRIGYLDPDTLTSVAAEQLTEAFDGLPPAAMIVDLRSSRDSVILRRTRDLLRGAWFSEPPFPPCLGLFNHDILELPDWPAYVDDFAMPPYEYVEIAARMKRLLFARRHVRTDNSLKIDGLTIDIDGHRAIAESGEVLPLTPREFDLLAFLAQHRNMFFSRERLLDLVWGIDFEGGWRTVDIHVRRLRSKLPPPVADRIETRRGAGYGLCVAPSESYK